MTHVGEDWVVRRRRRSRGPFVVVTPPQGPTNRPPRIDRRHTHTLRNFSSPFNAAIIFLKRHSTSSHPTSFRSVSPLQFAFRRTRETFQEGARVGLLGNQIRQRRWVSSFARRGWGGDGGLRTLTSRGHSVMTSVAFLSNVIIIQYTEVCITTF